MKTPAVDAVDAYVALGGNLGDALATFAAALDALDERAPAIEVCAVAPAYRSEAMMPPGTDERDPDYWNTVAHLRTQLSPRALLETLLAIEERFGRVRAPAVAAHHWRSRTLDLDLLLYGARTLSEPGLTVPHPGLAVRLFVLRPLCDLAPTVALPDGTTAAALLARHPDPEAGIRERVTGWCRPRERHAPSGRTR